MGKNRSIGAIRYCWHDTAVVSFYTLNLKETHYSRYVCGAIFEMKFTKAFASSLEQVVTERMMASTRVFFQASKDYTYLGGSESRILS